MDVEVRVPATVANLGPGFDCLGAAIATYLRIKVSGSDKPEVAGEGPLRPVSENLTHRAFTSGYAAVDQEAPPVRVETLEAYPSARGLGASASAIVAGLVSARHIGELDLSDADLGRLAVRIEGHADNVLPALFGGLVLSAQDGWVRFEPVNEITPLVLIARDKFKTQEARLVLPAEVPRADAVANSAATATLIAVLTGQQPAEALLVATEDRIHEPYRLPLMPETLDLHAALRGKGIPTALAGAGPSLVCLIASDRRAEALDLAQDLVPEGWQVLLADWDLHGAQVR